MPLTEREQAQVDALASYGWRWLNGHVDLLETKPGDVFLTAAGLQEGLPHVALFEMLSWDKDQQRHDLTHINHDSFVFEPAKDSVGSFDRFVIGKIVDRALVEPMKMRARIGGAGWWWMAVDRMPAIVGDGRTAMANRAYFERLPGAEIAISNP